MFVKFCGFTRPQDVEAACSMGISACGFVFYSGSKRCCRLDAASKCIAICRRYGVMSVGVFADNNMLSILSIAEVLKLDAVQIHTIGLYYQLSPRYTILYTTRVGGNQSINGLPLIHKKDFYLFDTYDSSSMGGTGNPFDWNAAASFTQLNRTIIAGGINAATLPKLLCVVQPYGIDIASGIEDAPGIKNIDTMNSLLLTIKELGYDISR